MAVRLVDTIDSETSQQGQTFHATLDSPLAVDGEVAIPSGYDVEGHLVEVKSAGKFAGQSVVALQLDRISAGGKYYSLQTDQYRRQGSSRGKNTVEKVGAGAGIGAIIGAIAGGGKGAAHRRGSRRRVVGWRCTSGHQGPANQAAFGNRAEFHPAGSVDGGRDQRPQSGIAIGWTPASQIPIRILTGQIRTGQS